MPTVKALLFWQTWLLESLFPYESCLAVGYLSKQAFAWREMSLLNIRRAISGDSLNQCYKTRRIYVILSESLVDQLEIGYH